VGWDDAFFVLSHIAESNRKQKALMQIVRRLLATAVSAAISVPHVMAQNVSVGQQVPSFQLAKFGGGTVSSSDYPGKILFLNFFGSY
jgi:hypothetical protein